jgi:hypothetical protein
MNNLGAVRPHAHKVLWDKAIHAVAGHTFIAGLAVTTGQKGEYNVIASFQIDDLTADLLNDTGTFVAQHCGQGYWQMLLFGCYIRMTYANTYNFDQYFIITGVV